MSSIKGKTMHFPLFFRKKGLSVHSAQTNLIVLIIVLMSVSQLLSCGENRIANSAATRWLGTYSGTGNMEIWNHESESNEPNKSTYPNRNVSIEIQEKVGIDAFLSGIKLTVTYTLPDNTNKQIYFPSRGPITSNAPNLSNHLHLSADTLSSITHSGSFTYNLDLVRQGEGFMGSVKGAETQASAMQDPKIAWSLHFIIQLRE